MQVYDSQPWSRQPQFASFWAHFEAADQWRQKHIGMFRSSIPMTTAVFDSRNNSDIASTSTQSTPKNKKNKKKIQWATIPVQPPPPPPVPKTVNITVTEEPMDVDIDEEYLEFRRKTLEHQKQRQKLKDEEAKKPKDDHWFTVDNEEYILADKIGVHGPQKRTLEAPDELAKNEKRRREAKQLYGKNAEKLLAMETALDMRFDEEFRRHQPQLWPNIPLKL